MNEALNIWLYVVTCFKLNLQLNIEMQITKLKNLLSETKSNNTRKNFVRKETEGR